MEPWNTQIPKAILSRENDTGGILCRKLYYQAIVTKAAWPWHKDRHVQPWVEERTQREAHTAKPPNFWQICQNTHQRRDSLFNKNCVSTIRRTEIFIFHLHKHQLQKERPQLKSQNSDAGLGRHFLNRTTAPHKIGVTVNRQERKNEMKKL